MSRNWRRRDLHYAGLAKDSGLARAEVMRLRSPAEVEAFADSLARS